MFERAGHRLFALPRPFFVALAIFIIIGFVTSHGKTRLTLYELGSSFVVPSQSDVAPLRQSLEELEAGTWVPRQYTVDPAAQWRGAYKTLEALWDPLEGEDDNAREDAIRVRARAIASWEWLGDGAIQEPVNWQELAVRMLRSTGGLILVGDSLTGQLFEQIAYAVFPPVVNLREESALVEVHGGYFPAPAVKTLHLSPDLPISQELLDRAGAPAARLERPLVSFFRDDTLLSEPQLRALVASTLGLTPEQAAEPGRVTNVLVGNWTAKVEAAISPVLLGPDASWTGNDTSVVVVNTGAHWAPDSLVGFDEAQMLAAYRKGVGIALPALRALAHTTALVRPTTPGHARCGAFRAPAAYGGELAPLTFRGNFGWSVFAAFNDAWVAAMRAADAPDMVTTAPSRWAELGEQRAASWGVRPRGYLPVFLRSLLRPDAHRLVGGDCLHVAGPSVLDEWLGWIWKEVNDIDSKAETA